VEYIPVKTRILKPPQDDLFKILNESLTDIKSGDIVAISSKVVAIHEGACVPIEGTDKTALVTKEAELAIPRDYWPSPLTVKCNAFIGTAGVDESNGSGYYILLPRNPFLSAELIHQYLVKKFGVTDICVIITDSHSAPLRRGAMGVAIGFYGFLPIINHVGKPDLFGREMRIEVSNLVDALAAGAGVVMGETNESQPVVILRGTPGVTFAAGRQDKEFMVDFKEDTFRVLYEKWLK
jgi:F420-0:gamma-glutamyl ligase